jgi:5-methyltetrahydrofolate--homocysteine methyltransferase
MAMAAGLDAAIINPKDKAMMDAWRSAMVLLNRDHQAAAYIEAYRGEPAAGTPVAPISAAPLSIRDQLTRAVINGERDSIVALVEEAFSQGLTPLQVSNEGFLPGLEEVGRRFERNIFFLPQVMQSADTMQTGFARLKEEMKGQPFESRGRILMATVEGDIHDIGKNIVCTLLENHGFEVFDIGKNVSAATIIAKAKEFSVHAVGLSALMTTTMSEMDNVIKKLRAAGVKTFTMVGGAVVTQEYADRIGADLYARDAMEAVARIKEILSAAD